MLIISIIFVVKKLNKRIQNMREPHQTKTKIIFHEI